MSVPNTSTPSAAPYAVPYADPEPMAELVAECRCVEAECAAHGVDLHPVAHLGHCAPAGPVTVDEATRHLVDGYPDYGG